MFIEFAPYDDAYGYRIKQFTLELKNTQEYISKECQGVWIMNLHTKFFIETKYILDDGNSGKNKTRRHKVRATTESYEFS